MKGVCQQVRKDNGTPFLLNETGYADTVTLMPRFHTYQAVQVNAKTCSCIHDDVTDKCSLPTRM